jgi:hypothetical protein
MRIDRRYLLTASRGGDDDDGNPGETGVAGLHVTELPAVHHRHHQVEQDHARALAAEDVEGRASVLGGADRESLEL